jgi:hypothetical protein
MLYREIVCGAKRSCTFKIVQAEHCIVEVSDFELRDVSGFVAECSFGLHANLVGAAEFIEVVHIGRT